VFYTYKKDDEKLPTDTHKLTLIIFVYLILQMLVIAEKHDFQSSGKSVFP